MPTPSGVNARMEPVVKIELVEAWQLILLSCANDKTLCVGQPASVVVCKARLLDASRSTGSDWKQLYVRGPSNVVGSAARDH